MLHQHWAYYYMKSQLLTSINPCPTVHQTGNIPPYIHSSHATLVSDIDILIICVCVCVCVCMCMHVRVCVCVCMYVLVVSLSTNI